MQRRDKPRRVICFSEIQWKYLRTRKQQVITRFPEEWRILFLSSVVKGRRNNFIPEREGNVLHVCVPIFKNFPQRSIKALFSLAPLRFLWNIMILLWLNVLFILTGFGGRDRIFYVSNIYYGAVLPFLKRSLMFYDCNDDHLGFPDTPPWAERYYRSVALRADFAIAVSTGLAEKLRASGVRSVHRIGNGVDFELFSEAAKRGTPEELEGLGRPRIGYAGVIAPWFDFGLLDHIASSFPGASVIIIGPVFDACRRELADVSSRHGNVHHIGAKEYSELGRYLAAMDVCIIPLEMSELRRLADPNKIYEYAATGRPIVTLKYSADLEPLREFVYLAETREEFVTSIERALAGEAPRELLLDFARRNSWRARADAISRLIGEALDRQGHSAPA